MKRTKSRVIYTGVGLVGAAMVLVALGSPAIASSCEGETIPPHTVVDAGSIDSLENKCFDGYRVGDLIHEKLAWMVRKHGAYLRLIPHAPLQLPYRIVRATEKYRGQARLDPETGELLNFAAGVPFPDVELDDPHAAVKVIWNFFYGRPKGDQFGSKGISTDPNFVYTFVESNVGLERVQRWNFSRYHLRGRVTDHHTIGDGSIAYTSLLFATFPQDVKGLGTYVITYHTPKLVDVWAYIRAVRRVRRLSGGAWVDPIGATDLLQDDIFGFNAHPSWYKGFRLLGKRWLFHVGDSQRGVGSRNERASWLPGKDSLEETFPRLVFKPPYWNMDDFWMPREAYVIEATPPDHHPYGKKILHIDAENWEFLFADAYDKKGDFWKWMQFAQRGYETNDGFIDPRTGKPEIYWFTAWNQFIDFQRMHATHAQVGPNFLINTVGTDVNDFSIGTLEAAGR